jgi:hypothetical protein
MSSTPTRHTRNFIRFLPGGTLAVIGSLTAIAGGGLLAAFGTDSRLASGPHLLSTPTAAILSPIASIKNTSGVATVTGQPTLRISASPVHGTAGVFIGIARAADVDRYLTGVATQQVTNLSVEPHSITGTRHGGRREGRAPQGARAGPRTTHLLGRHVGPAFGLRRVSHRCSRVPSLARTAHITLAIASTLETALGRASATATQGWSVFASRAAR